MAKQHPAVSPSNQGGGVFENYRRPGSSIRSAGFEGRRIRLNTLVRLRWMAIAGQSAAVVLVHFWFAFPLPLGWCFALIAVSAWLNLFLNYRFASSRRLDELAATALLAYDVLQLTGLLFLTGGLENPFAFLLLAPVTVSAAILPPQRTIVLGLLVVVAASVLAMVHLPLPWTEGEKLDLPLVYVAGMWTALVLGLSFMAIYTFRVAKEARQLADALAATELVLAHEQHLSALDGMAAAAAHELGTPLATIAVISKEMEREIPAESPLAEDARLLRSQSERCREILSKLTSLSGDRDDPYGRQQLAHLIEDVVAPHREFGIEITVSLAGEEGPEPATDRNPAVLYGIGNFLENAVDFAQSRVDVRATWTDKEVVIGITDDGAGIADALVGRIGEPYVTSRLPDQVGGGLGLGVFIAKTLLERSGAVVDISNRRLPDYGAIVRIVWPRAVFEASRAEPLEL
jgi:two-component system sensor histidine kinase RegB